MESDVQSGYSSHLCQATLVRTHQATRGWRLSQDLGIDGKIEAGLDGESFDCEMEELRPGNQRKTTRDVPSGTTRHIFHLG